MTPTGKVYLIGAGPGDAELLTLRALRMLQSADAVVHDRLVSQDILDLAPAGVRMIPVGKAPKCHTVPQDRINEILAELAEQGLTVARLKGGDPLIFGRGSEEAAYLADRGLAVEYAPGITAAQGMAAATGIPLTHRGLATGVRYVTGHRAADQRLDLDWASLADTDTTLVVYMGAANISEIALNLMREGMPASLPVMAICAATTSQESRLISRLDQIGVDIRAQPMPAPVLFVIGRVVSLYQAGTGATGTAARRPAVAAGE
ncbi:uroporphyrinogen-III C-methyltransferase [Sedimentitalea sp. HM32M-2]|uniref:uroporphyrinogen-III C-methyltransferase n=1 Tax=Sedimentitalea sp. HM32M-2 TaxID=3351566 RepID=UPI00363AADDC